MKTNKPVNLYNYQINLINQALKYSKGIVGATVGQANFKPH